MGRRPKFIAKREGYWKWPIRQRNFRTNVEDEAILKRLAEGFPDMDITGITRMAWRELARVSKLEVSIANPRNWPEDLGEGEDGKRRDYPAVTKRLIRDWIEEEEQWSRREALERARRDQSDQYE